MIEQDDSAPTERTDFRRANGAPQWMDREGKNQRGSRPSGWGKTLDEETALINWKIDRAIAGVASDAALQARGVAVSQDEAGRSDRGVLREAAIAAGRGAEAADIGTALHAMSERWEKEPDFSPPEPYLTALTAYGAGLERLGLISELYEYHIVNEEYRAAGTVDRLYHVTVPLVAPDGTTLPVGTLIVGDLKTGKKLDFSLPGYLVQLAIYAQGQFYNVVSDTFMPTPEINPRWAIIVHMPSQGDKAGTCEFLWADLEVGNYGAWLVHEVRDWRKKWRNGTYSAPEIAVSQPLEPGAVAAHLQQLAVDSLVAPQPVEKPVDTDFEKLRTWMNHRLAQIGAHKESRTRITQIWPESIPILRHCTTMAELATLLPVFDQVEDQYELSFVPGDPRDVGTKKQDAIS